MIFSLLSFFVAVPSAIKVFNWTATLYKGHITFDAPLLYAFSFIALFTIGGMTGLMLASLAVDVHVTQTYFIVAHFHYIMVGGAVMAYLGGIHYWFPKITGRMYPRCWRDGRRPCFSSDSTWPSSRSSFSVTWACPAATTFIRRNSTAQHHFHQRPAPAGDWLFLPLTYLGWSAFFGRVAGPNPWDAPGLEWQIPSPPPSENFVCIPIVTRKPYGYDPPPDIHEPEQASEESHAR